MIDSVLLGVLRFVVECLISLFWWFILFPVVWLVSLPLILIVALFRRERYGSAVTSMLETVHGAWRDYGHFILP